MYLLRMTYSFVHISSDEVFSKILKKPCIVQEKMIPHMKALGLFDKMKQKKTFFEKRNQNGRLKKGHFPALNFQFSIFFCKNFMDWVLG